MRAVVIRAHGGLDALELTERPDPIPGPGEVRVRVRAVGLNHLDIWVRRGVPGPHVSGKRVVAGHTSQKNGKILNLGHLVCIDTYCYGGGWLTALDVHHGVVWQVDSRGVERRRRSSR